jgi:hypothetical protein
VNRAEFERELGRPLIDKRHFVEDVGAAVRDRRPYAAGKIGHSEHVLLMYPLLVEAETDPRRLRAFEISLAPRALRHAGVFPPDPSFYRGFGEQLASDMRALDCLGLFDPGLSTELRIIQGHGFEGDLIEFTDQEPDRSIPADDTRCYLPSFREARVLLVCPFADLLATRADRETYEEVWSKIGKRWFEPASVESVTFPYGYDLETQRTYGTALNLLEEIDSRIGAQEFDVALIGAGALGIPIAAAVKRQGGLGISLGGHLQVIFGVHGERWLSDPEWRRNYINEFWIRVPEDRAPDMATTEENYW